MKTLLVLPCALLATSLLAAFAPDRGNDRVFRADLSGDQEVPPVATDTSGELRIQFAQDYSSAELRLDVNDGERITQAHFHCGEAGVNGPVVIFLAGFHANGWDVDGRWIDNVTITDQNIVNTACGTTLRDIAQAMEEGRIYVNVHSVAVPSGVVRGQVERH
ncbi:MAG TPA: CHRD domain-containing protein [Planctomycetota bacterium]